MRRVWVVLKECDDPWYAPHTISIHKTKRGAMKWLERLWSFYKGKFGYEDSDYPNWRTEYKIEKRSLRS